EVLPALAVPQPAPLAPDERHREAGVRAHDVGGVERRQFVETHGSPRVRAGRHGTTMVPTPWRVKHSRSRAWGMRPSSRWARPTPLCSAETQDLILGTIPSESAPPVSMASSSAAVI